jgi:hypothetical protein
VFGASIAFDNRSTTVSDEIASKSYRCGVQVGAVALLFGRMVPNKVLAVEQTALAAAQIETAAAWWAANRLGTLRA